MINSIHENRLASELESAIIDMWGMKEHVLLFLKRYSDIPDPLTEDEVANHLLGIAYTIDLKAYFSFGVFWGYCFLGNSIVFNN